MIVSYKEEGNWKKGKFMEIGGSRAYHFSSTMPFGVKLRIYSLPLPTSPKFAAVATAIRESKKGEYLTEKPLKPWVRYSSIVEGRSVVEVKALEREVKRLMKGQLSILCI